MHRRPSWQRVSPTDEVRSPRPRHPLAARLPVLLVAAAALAGCTGPVRLGNGSGPETLQQAVFKLRETHPVDLPTRLRHPEEALDRLADAVRREHDAAGSPPNPAIQRDFVDLLPRLDPSWFHRTGAGPAAIGPVPVVTRVDPACRWGPDRLVSLAIADEHRIDGLRTRHRRDGFGVPMVASVAVPDDDPLSPFHPPGGLHLPVTAVVTGSPDDVTGAITVTLHDPRTTTAIPFGNDGRLVPLAADFTAPFAFHAAEHAEFATRRVVGIFRPDHLAGQVGLHLLEPYDPERIPLLMVHGFASSPLTWLDVTNDILGDPQLRSRYQIWHYHYPTGLSWLAAAADFRHTLDAFRSQVEALTPPSSPAAGDWVVVAHSLGGLLAKTLVSSSRGALWNALDTPPIDSLDLTGDDRAALRALFEFEPAPCVGRLVFVASPLNGSGMAGSPYARLGAALTETPDLLDGLAARTAHALARERDDLDFDKVTLLAENHPVTTTFAGLPVERPFHLVLGRKFPLPGDDRFTDGVVSSDAARVAGAVSELVVGTDTHNVHHKPAAITEIRRILREHAATPPDPATP